MVDGQLSSDRNRRTVLLVYILYFLGFATGVSAAAGVFIAHSKNTEMQGVWRSHVEYLIRTFWIGLAMLFAGALLAVVLIGWVVIVAWTVWTLIRCVKGVIAALEDRPIDDPQTLMW